MGSGFNFFANGIDVTPETTGEYTEVDVSGKGVPVGSSGAIIEIHCLHSGDKRVSFRKNGSSDDRVVNAYGNYNVGVAFVQLDSNRIFETYLEDSLTKLYLIGYTDDAVVYKDPPVDISPSGTGSWEVKDLSGEISDAVGVIIQGYATDGSGEKFIGARCNGSSDEFTYGEQYSACQRWYIIKVDAENKVELKRSATQGIFCLIAYLKSPIVMFADGKDQSVATTQAWTDCDITSDTDEDADGVILFLKNAGTGTQYDGNVRKNGSTDDRISQKLIRGNATAGRCVGHAIGMDSSQIFEYYIDHADIDIYVMGYCKPAGGQIYEINVDAVVKASALHAEQCTFNIEKDAAVTSEAVKASESSYNILKDAITNALADVSVEVISGIIEIFKDAVVQAQATFTVESAFNITEDAISQATATVNIETVFTVVKDAIIKASAAPKISSVFPINVEAVVKASAAAELQQTLNISEDAVVVAVSTPLIQSTFNISPEAVVKVLAEVTVIKEGEALKVTKLFLILGNIAIQLTGD